MLRDSVQAFAAEQIAPRAEAIDRDNQFPRRPVAASSASWACTA